MPKTALIKVALVSTFTTGFCLVLLLLLVDRDVVLRSFSFTSRSSSFALKASAFLIFSTNNSYAL